MKIKYCKDCDNYRIIINVSGNEKFICDLKNKETNPFSKVCKKVK